MKKYLLGFVMLTVWLTGCAVRHNMKSSSQNFSMGQLGLIMAADKEVSMRIFKIDNFQDSLLLRTACEEVVLGSKDAALDHFVSRLYSTVRDSISMGVGIAAPQVGVLKRIVWVQRFDKEGYPFEVYYNPRIVNYSDEKQDCREGCLSIPNRRDTTRVRSKSIQIEYNLLKGEKMEETVTDFTAVIFQHEIDHLDGILYLDHLEKEAGNTAH
ncbi:MAG: peptide deformylase [Reichenbachiella sp.]